MGGELPHTQAPFTSQPAQDRFPQDCAQGLGLCARAYESPEPLAQALGFVHAFDYANAPAHVHLSQAREVSLGSAPRANACVLACAKESLPL